MTQFLQKTEKPDVNDNREEVIATKSDSSDLSRISSEDNASLVEDRRRLQANSHLPELRLVEIQNLASKSDRNQDGYLTRKELEKSIHSSEYVAYEAGAAQQILNDFSRIKGLSNDQWFFETKISGKDLAAYVDQQPSVAELKNKYYGGLVDLLKQKKFEPYEWFGPTNEHPYEGVRPSKPYNFVSDALDAMATGDLETFKRYQVEPSLMSNAHSYEAMDQDITNLCQMVTAIVEKDGGSIEYVPRTHQFSIRLPGQHSQQPYTLGEVY